jgi:hypothetical protein
LWQPDESHYDSDSDWNELPARSTLRMRRRRKLTFMQPSLEWMLQHPFSEWMLQHPSREWMFMHPSSEWMFRHPSREWIFMQPPSEWMLHPPWARSWYGFWSLRRREGVSGFVPEEPSGVVDEALVREEAFSS